MTLRMPRRLSPAGFPHRGGALVVLLATFALGGCEVLDIIEDPPEIQPRLIVDGENTTLTVAQLLPSSVTISYSPCMLPNGVFRGQPEVYSKDSPVLRVG